MAGMGRDGGGRRRGGKKKPEDKKRPAPRRYEAGEEPPKSDSTLDPRGAIDRKKHKEWWNKEGRELHNKRFAEDGRVKAMSPQDSYIWKKLTPYKKSNKDNRFYRTNGSTGRNLRYYSWDYEKGEFEVFDHRKRHLGSFDPKTGHQKDGPKSKRRLPKDIVRLGDDDEDHAVV